MWPTCSLTSTRRLRKKTKINSTSKSSVDRPVGGAVKDIAIDAEGLGFDFRAGQIRNRVDIDSPPPRCFFRAVLPRHLAVEIDPAARYTLRCITASIMKIVILFQSTWAHQQLCIRKAGRAFSFRLQRAPLSGEQEP